MGAYHLVKNSGNFGLRSNIMEKQFPAKFFENCGQLPEVVSFSVRNAVTICDNRSVSRPFLTRSGKYAEWNAG